MSSISSASSRPHTPPNAAPSPIGSKALLMPHPIRTNIMLPPALLDRLDDEPTVYSIKAPEAKQEALPLEGVAVSLDTVTIAVAGVQPRDGVGVAAHALADDSMPQPGGPQATPPAVEPAPLVESAPMGDGDGEWRTRSVAVARPSHSEPEMPSRPGAPVVCDPYGRDQPRRTAAEASSEWTVEPLVKYLRGVVAQIDSNLQKNCLPSNEKLDAYVKKMVAGMRQHLKHAPKRVWNMLDSLCARRLQKFWNFTRNQKTRQTTPEELRTALVDLIEVLSKHQLTGLDAQAPARDLGVGVLGPQGVGVLGPQVGVGILGPRPLQLSAMRPTETEPASPAQL